jgi:hypothetical protein
MCREACVDHYYHNDHVSTSDKDGTIMAWVNSGESFEPRIRDELAKCRLLCIYCHSNVTLSQTISGELSMVKHLARLVKSGASPDVLHKHEADRKQAEMASKRILSLMQTQVTEHVKNRWLLLVDAE